MTTTSLNPLTLWKSESRTLTFTVTDDSVPPVAQNISTLNGGFSLIEFEIKKLAGDADPALLHKAVGTGITVLTQSGATLGQFTLTLLPTDLLAIVAGQYTYDLVIQYADGTRTYIIRPTMVIIFDVVNPQ